MFESCRPDQTLLANKIMSATNGKVESVLLFNYLDLPGEMQCIIRWHPAFGNDRYVEYVSEFSPCEEHDTWKDCLTTSSIESYWKDQCESNGYKHDLDKFIRDYGLLFDTWLLSSNFDLNVRKILIRVSW